MMVPIQDVQNLVWAAAFALGAQRRAEQLERQSPRRSTAEEVKLIGDAGLLAAERATQAFRLATEALR